EILDADPALAPRMEALRERLEEMDVELSSLRRALSGMCGLDGEVPADLERAEDRRRELLGWSVGCRSLGGEIDTWFTEAYYRDRGVGASRVPRGCAHESSSAAPRRCATRRIASFAADRRVAFAAAFAAATPPPAQLALARFRGRQRDDITHMRHV